MSTSELGTESVFNGGNSIPLPRELSLSAAEANGGRQQRSMHRLQTVRREQGMSLRRVAQLLKTDVETVRREEDESSDLPLSRLHQWQQILDVPLTDLLVDAEGPLSTPVLTRARLVRLMKTVTAIVEQSDNRRVRVLAERMADQLKEIMPELENITPWHSVGQRRSAEEIGRVGQHPVQLDRLMET